MDPTPFNRIVSIQDGGCVAGVMLAAAALAATRVEEEVQKSMDEAAE